VRLLERSILAYRRPPTLPRRHPHPRPRLTTDHLLDGLFDDLFADLIDDPVVIFALAFCYQTPVFYEG